MQGGEITIATKDGEKRVRLTRAHLEEDAGKSLHEDFHGMTGIDLNRAGTPLLEIVSEPDMASSEEAVTYAKALHALVRWIGICDGNMQEGSFRCDANVSVRRPGAPLGTRCEIKNLNSFRFLQHAIDYEARRQIHLIEDGGTVVQETRLYDPDRGETRSMRSKEDAQDYRYFPDPDLPPLVIEAKWIDDVRAALPELPAAMKMRFEQQYALTPYDATMLTQTQETAGYFEDAVRAFGGEPKTVVNWMLGDFFARLHKAEIDIADAPVGPAALAALLKRVGDGTISGKIAKDVFDAMWSGEAVGENAADAIIEKQGLQQISDDRGHREDHRRRARRESRDRRRVPGGQGEGVQLARRQGDGRHQGQGQSRAGQCDSEGEAGMRLRRFCRILALASGLALGGCATAPHPSDISEADRNQIQAALNASVNGWNEGSLPQHLSLYDPAVTMMTREGPRPGVAAIETAFRATYFVGDKPKQSLRMERVDVRSLSKDSALMTGRFILEGGGLPEQSGWFTLVWVRTAGGWKVVHDHTS